MPPFDHPSGLSGAYDRTAQRPDWSEVIARDSTTTGGLGFLAQGADINESQSIMRRRVQRVGNMVGRDGDRVFGANIAVVLDDDEAETGSVNLAGGLVYADGDVRTVAARVIADVALAGEVIVGIRLATTYVTEEDDPALYGLHPGSLAEGEPGSARAIETASWALSTEDGDGRFFSVYQIVDGTVIDQTPPPSLTGINQALAQYDRGSNGGNYVVTGCRVTALGPVAGAQLFSIEEGEANIFGFKRTRTTALRFSEPMAWDVETIAAEPHTFADGGTGTATITVNRGPIDTINSVIITKQVTETVVRGVPNNTSDALAHSGVTEILSVSQGATTYEETTDYTLSGDHVNWAPGGAEPAGGSSYSVTYRYLDAAMPSAVTSDTFNVSGGVTGTQVTVGYDWRLPRIDLLCLDQSGNASYITGAPARDRPVPPIAPVTILALAEVHNDWRGAPAIVNNGTRAVHFPLLWRYLNKVIDLIDLAALERLKRDIDSREPSAKRGVFVDPCINDFYRDEGEPQTAAVFNGSIQLAIDPTFHEIAMDGPIMLPYEEEIVIEQPLVTGCVKINPYDNFDPLPGKLAITPSQDFWTISQTEWLSAQTRQISGTSNRTTVADVVVDEREELLEFLREIDIAFTVSGLGEGETLDELLFDGIDVTPAGPLVGDANGEASGTFAIPADVVAGSKLVEATGGSGMKAFATFVGQGRVDITTMRRTTLIEVAPTPVERRPSRQGLSNNGQKIGDGADPQSQTFAVPRDRHLLGVDIKPCAIGNVSNPIIVDLVTVETGLPTTDVMASALVPMTGVAVDTWLETRWPGPAFVTADRLNAFVLKTDDGTHSVSIADVGGFDAAAQQWVGAQPYTTGDRLDGSNGITWLPHPGSDLTFRMVAAHFTSTTRTVVLGEVDLVDCSDLLIAAAVELPTADCGFYFEVERAGGEVLRLAPYQVHEFTEYVTETVELRAVLTGTEFVSPTLFPGVMVISGKLRATGTYVSRAFTFGTMGVELMTRFKALLPAGSSVTVEYDLADDDWTAISLTSSEALNDGWAERLHDVASVTGFEGRIRLTLSGTPAARPSLADLRSTTF